jgi:hypothetical protein
MRYITNSMRWVCPGAAEVEGSEDEASEASESDLEESEG